MKIFFKQFEQLKMKLSVVQVQLDLAASEIPSRDFKEYMEETSMMEKEYEKKTKIGICTYFVNSWHLGENSKKHGHKQKRQ